MLARSIDATDPLSDLLALAEVRPVVSGEFRASGPWALRFAPPQGMKFLGMARGSAHLHIDGGATVALAAGDVILMNHTLPYVLASESDVASRSDVVAQDGQALLAALAPDHRLLVLGAGDETALIGGHVRLDRERGLALAQLLPPLVHVAAAHDGASELQWLLTQLVRERAGQALGHQAMSAHLAYLLFLQVLRLHLSQQALTSASWLRVLADRQLLPAVKLMHAEPGRDWRLDQLARACAMSRTSFALRFRAHAGTTPMVYLTQWRMLLARRMLERDPRPLSAWIAELGYASESAFSHAFKRHAGLSPGQYRAGAASA